jgi:hypothetical protein
MDSSSLSRRDACNLFPVNAVYVYVPAQMHANSKSAQPHISDFKYPGVSFSLHGTLPCKHIKSNFNIVIAIRVEYSI